MLLIDKGKLVHKICRLVNRAIQPSVCYSTYFCCMLLQAFQRHVKENFPWLSTINSRFVLAVSGGIDSVVMTDLFNRSGFEFVIAHCNFRLRGDESFRDELFMTSLAEKYGKKFLIQQFDTKEYAASHKISIQEAARKLRYDWFEELVNSEWPIVNEATHHSPLTAHFLATAHNADDNIETMLMFLFRGTGIHGLTGIKAVDKKRKILRPLLFASRQQIESYAEEQGLDWVEDSSNLTDKYTRNFFRHKIIPLAEEQFATAKQNLQHTMQHLQDAAILYNQSIEWHKKNLLEYKGKEIHIPVLKLQQSTPLDTIIREIIKPYHFHPQQVAEVQKLLNAVNSSYVESSTHKIIKNRNWLIIAPKEHEEAVHIVIEANDKAIQYKNGVLQLEITHHSSLITHHLTAQLDAAKIQFPLLLRKWKQGDYFYPLGMQKKKKLSRFFIDAKLSATQKENVWVLEMNKKIIWVIGHRIDDRFKIIPPTKEILVIKSN